MRAGGARGGAVALAVSAAAACSSSALEVPGAAVHLLDVSAGQTRIALSRDVQAAGAGGQVYDPRQAVHVAELHAGRWQLDDTTRVDDGWLEPFLHGFFGEDFVYRINGDQSFREPSPIRLLRPGWSSFVQVAEGVQGFGVFGASHPVGVTYTRAPRPVVDGGDPLDAFVSAFQPWPGRLEAFALADCTAAGCSAMPVADDADAGTLLVGGDGRRLLYTAVTVDAVVARFTWMLHDLGAATGRALGALTVPLRIGDKYFSAAFAPIAVTDPEGRRAALVLDAPAGWAVRVIDLESGAFVEGFAAPEDIVRPPPVPTGGAYPPQMAFVDPDTLLVGPWYGEAARLFRVTAGSIDEVPLPAGATSWFQPTGEGAARRHVIAYRNLPHEPGRNLLLAELFDVDIADPGGAWRDAGRARLLAARVVPWVPLPALGAGPSLVVVDGIERLAAEDSYQGTLARLDLAAGARLPLRPGYRAEVWESVMRQGQNPVVLADGRTLFIDEPDDDPRLSGPSYSRYFREGRLHLAPAGGSAGPVLAGQVRRFLLREPPTRLYLERLRGDGGTTVEVRDL